MIYRLYSRILPLKIRRDFYADKERTKIKNRNSYPMHGCIKTSKYCLKTKKSFKKKKKVIM